MSKITFRADDDLIRRLEEFDASKSEVMREALRAYLDGRGGASAGAPEGDRGVGASDGDPEESLEERIDERLDELVAARLEGLEDAFTRTEPQDVNVNITLDGDSASVSQGSEGVRKTDRGSGDGASDGSPDACKQCGEHLPASAVYCSNCGEKSSHRVFCECGDELRSDWGFCPGCGRRTPAADVLHDS